MTLLDSFTQVSLENRLGQTVELAVFQANAFGHDYIFVAALTQKASSLVAKNAEHFAFQLRDRFQLDAKRLKIIELRGDATNPQFWRWRFEWVGNSPLSPKCEFIAAVNQQKQMFNLLNISDNPQSATA